MDEADDLKGGKWGIRLHELREWHRIQVRCHSCQHVGTLDPAAVRAPWFASLRRRFSALDDKSLFQRVDYSRLGDLETLLRCRECDRRGYNSFDVVKLPRNT